VLPALTSATLPNLNAGWFLRAYAISFAAAILIAVVLLIPQVVRTARGAQAGRDLVDSVGLYFGVFLLGAMFGPAFGMVLVNFFHAVSNVVVAWGIQGSA
jgi:type IV secretion system protein TrbL